MLYKVISMYTPGTPYEEEVKELAQSCEKFALEYKLYPIENRGDWVQNTQQKAEVIQRALQEFPCDLLWLDADAVILKRPPLFEQLAQQEDFHICMHRADYKRPAANLREKISNFLKRRRHPHGELISNTMYIKNLPATKQLVAEWLQLNQQQVEWDQRTLQAIADRDNSPYVFRQLPPQYAKIVPRGQGLANIDDGSNFIGQKQASRRLKDKV